MINGTLLTINDASDGLV